MAFTEAGERLASLFPGWAGLVITVLVSTMLGSAGAAATIAPTVSGRAVAAATTETVQAVSDVFCLFEEEVLLASHVPAPLSVLFVATLLVSGGALDFGLRRASLVAFCPSLLAFAKERC